jgi:hypothetical protein
MRSRLAVALLAAWLVIPPVAADDKLPAGIAVDRDKKTVTIDAKVAPRKVLEEVYPIEVIACWPYKKDPKPGGQLGAKPGKPGYGEDTPAEGPEVAVFIDVPQDGGTFKRLSLDKVLLDPKTKKPIPKSVRFKFTGSGPSKAAPGQPAKEFGADTSGSLIYIFPVDVETVFQSSLSMKDEKYLKLEVNKDVLPKEGEPVKLVIELSEKK